jgi:hypothetical protein
MDKFYYIFIKTLLLVLIPLNLPLPFNKIHFRSPFAGAQQEDGKGPLPQMYIDLFNFMTKCMFFILNVLAYFYCFGLFFILVYLYCLNLFSAVLIYFQLF